MSCQNRYQKAGNEGEWTQSRENHEWVVFFDGDIYYEICKFCHVKYAKA